MERRWEVEKRERDQERRRRLDEWHKLGIEKEERDMEERLNRAAGKRASWEVFRTWKSYIMENRKNWKETEERKEECEEKEMKKKERIRRAATKIEEFRENVLQ